MSPDGARHASAEPLAAPGLRETPKAFDWRGAAVLFSVVAFLAVARHDLAAEEWHAMFGSGDALAHFDWLLAGLGVFFLLCSLYDLQPRLDLATLAAGFAGGTLIELWGTRTGLWHYYTGERPPLWILPAWSMSALANERLLRFLLSRLPSGWRERVIAGAGGARERLAHRLVAAPLFAFFLWWSRPALLEPWTFAVGLLLLAAFWRASFPLYALSLLACGAALGVFLEIWGTTRHCWNYYDGHTPSPFPIFGHGMAAVSFWKLKEFSRSLVAASQRKSELLLAKRGFPGK